MSQGSQVPHEGVDVVERVVRSVHDFQAQVLHHAVQNLIVGAHKDVEWAEKKKKVG